MRKFMVVDPVDCLPQTAEGMEMIEIAPGIDLEKDVLAHMHFRPIIRDVTLMDAEIFRAEWGGLAGLLKG